MITVDANVWIAAFDPADVFHADSIALFTRIASRNITIHAPDFVEIEVACAVSRRRRDASAGIVAGTQLVAHPLLVLSAVDSKLQAEALRIGTSCFLRGADALYAATAHITQTTLVSWDDELVKRSSGFTPTIWLSRNP
jgi:predicted nucleic acid-binding protein